MAPSSLPRHYSLSRLARAAATLPEPRRQIVEVALAMVNSAAGSFDCSSFTKHVYSLAASDLPRTAQQQFQAGTRVGDGELEPGDLVFFAFKARPVDHVGIYTGQQTFVHVSASTRQVRLESLSKPSIARSYVGNRRFLGVFGDELQ